MTLEEITVNAIDPAMALLPRGLDDVRARVLLLAIGLQESRFVHRYQVVQGQPGAKGPARGFWQFELGTPASRGGVWGVYLHPSTAEFIRYLCRSRGVPCKPDAIWAALETDDVLAAGVSRLLIMTDAYKLPAVDDVDGAWRLYAQRCWRPGKPHPETWQQFHAQARAHLGA